MDRNEKYRQKLHAQSKDKPKRDAFKISGGFDPDPYVDVIIERLEEEMDNEIEADPNEFIKDMDRNPKLEIIFGKSSALNSVQKSFVITRLIDRLSIAKDFDSTPYIDELVELFDSGQFDQFKKFDKEGDFVYNFNDYYKDENFTKEQFKLIQSGFYKRQSGKASNMTKKLIPLFVLGILLVFIPPFFIPSFLQKMGWLSIDAGWFSKIGVGLLSLIVIFFLIKQLFFTYVDSFLKSEKNLILKDSNIDQSIT
jgi:hypothetical protein